MNRQLITIRLTVAVLIATMVITLNPKPKALNYY